MTTGGAVIERERKYRLDENKAKALEIRLRKEGTFLRSEMQDTIVLGGDDGRVRKGTLFRLREIDGKRTITFKGKKLEDGIDKTRPELTVELGAGPILPLLDGIGLVPIGRYLKDSLLFSFGGATVSIDRLDKTGVFVELECFDMTTDLGMIAEQLGLTQAEFEPRGYPRIAAAEAANHQRTLADLSGTSWGKPGEKP